MVDAHALGRGEARRREHDRLRPSGGHERRGPAGGEGLVHAAGVDDDRLQPLLQASEGELRRHAVPVAAAAARSGRAFSASARTAASGGIDASHSKSVETGPVRAQRRA